jgi:hypothetical protein
LDVAKLGDEDLNGASGEIPRKKRIRHGKEWGKVEGAQDDSVVDENPNVSYVGQYFDSPRPFVANSPFSFSFALPFNINVALGSVLVASVVDLEVTTWMTSPFLAATFLDTLASLNAVLEGIVLGRRDCAARLGAFQAKLQFATSDLGELPASFDPDDLVSSLLSLSRLKELSVNNIHLQIAPLPVNAVCLFFLLVLSSTKTCAEFCIPFISHCFGADL